MGQHAEEAVEEQGEHDDDDGGAEHLIVAPERLTRSWLGDDVSRPGTRVALRALGAREIVLHAGAIAAVLRGGDARSWFAGSIAGDLSDIAATFASRGGLPDGAAAKTAGVAGASAGVTAAVLAALEA